MQVLISGASFAGLSTAHWLARLGHQVTIVEIASGLREGGTAVDWAADPEWDFTSAAADTPEQLYAIWDDTAARSRERLAAAIADGGLDPAVHLEWPGRGHFSLPRLVCDMIEEYGRHTGHADLIREAVDGRVGEDPPAGWRPVEYARA